MAKDEHVHLACVVCLIDNRDKAAETIYQGHALCMKHLSKAVQTKERRVW